MGVKLSDKDFQVLFESAPAMYLVLTRDHIIVAVSDMYAKATMKRRDELINYNVFNVFPDNPNDPVSRSAQVRASFERVIATKQTDTLPLQKYDVKKPESEGGEFEERYWSAINSPVLDISGDVKYIIHRVEDVTEFVKLRKQLGVTSPHSNQVDASKDNFLLRHITSLGIIAVTLLMLLVSAMFYTQGKAVDYSKAMVQHTYEVSDQIQLLYNKIQNAELNHRGYIITGSQEYLDSYNYAVKGLVEDKTQLAKFKELVADNPVQVRNLDKAEKLIDAKLARMEFTSNTRREKGLDAAAREISTLKGKHIMDGIHGVMTDMRMEENRLLSTRSYDDKKNSQKNNALIFTAIGLFYVAMLLVIWLVTRQWKRVKQLGHEIFLRTQEISEVNKKLNAKNSELEDLNRRIKEQGLTRLGAVVDNAVDGLITITDKGLVESFNPACERIFGYKKHEVVGKNIKMLMPEPYRNEHDDYLKNYHKTGIAKIIGIGREVQGKRKDGSTFPMDLSVSAFDLEGARHYSGIIRDVTERKEAEKSRDMLRQAQKIEALGQLTGGIAHDFNNLLAVVLGNLDFLVEQTEAKDPLREYIKPSIEAAERGAELTQSLLAFGRKQTLQPKILSINDLIVNFSGLVKRTLGERIELLFSLTPHIWPVNIDASQFENALLNLSVNARDAMPKGGKLIYETKNVHLDADYADHNSEVIPGDYVMIAVTDTGEGMDQDTIEKAFEPFFTTKDVGKGSGLGLSMVHGFVKQSNGHIKIYSEKGHGTSIKIYLPRVEGKIDIIEKTKDISDEPVVKSSKVILVVEDNKEVLKLTSAMVSSLGYNVIESMSGEAALDILELRNDIDLLMTDVILSGDMNGPDLAKIAIKLHPHLKILFNSGYAESAVFKGGFLEEGANIISKPFRKSQLAGILRELLK